MNCPVDGTVLTMADRQGIEIDYCPKCRGVWLDRGELDKIIERSAAPAYAEPRGRDDDDDRRRYDDDDRRRYDDDDRRGYDSQGRPVAKKRKRGILEDLFDFG
jgi:Zn-finger nucleic acid-binding protein